MVFLTKRFSKIFKLSLVAALCCLAFMFSTKYFDKDLTSLEYGKLVDTFMADAGYGKDAQEVAGSSSDGTADNNGIGAGAKVSTSSNEKRKIAMRKFYTDVFNSLKKHSPTGVSKREYGAQCKLSGDIGARADDYDNWSKLTSKNLGQCLIVSDKEKRMLKEKHRGYVESLESLVLPKGAYKGDGIVTVGGGKFSMLAFLIIKTLRNLHTSLPVEVFIPPADEGETFFCNELLPQYNAKCIYISDVLPQEIIDNFEFKGYQFKSIAIIASSFDNLLLLDADNFPIKDLDNVFNEEPYKSKGMVLWPDFWRRTTNPIYYDIADIEVNYKKRVRNCMDDVTPPAVYTKDMSDLSNVPLHDLEGTIPDVSTESGQLMIRKSDHLGTILLSLYYNVNGPSWYYPIFSQKASGEGDKETFIAAANFYDLPFYQVKSVTAVDGYHQPHDKGFRGVAMLQHDFVQDYGRQMWAQVEIRSHFAGKDTQYAKYDPSYSPDAVYKKFFSDDNIGETDIMFVHSNLPKFDPYQLWHDQDLIVDGKHIRSYRNLKRLNGYDLELENFKIFNEYLCTTQARFKYLDDKLNGDQRNWKDMCSYIGERLKYLEQTHLDAIHAP